jgi:UDPglucose 6-dehydrogenase
MKLEVLQSVDDVNNRQKRVLVEKIVKTFGEDLKGFRFALWGLAFKPNTDDMREAPSLEVIDGLLSRGAEIRANDPEANGMAKRLVGDRIQIMEDQYDCLQGADALVIVTEWNEFRRPDFRRIKELLRRPYVFDGRNVFNPQRMIDMGFSYFCIGRG